MYLLFLFAVFVQLVTYCFYSAPLLNHVCYVNMIQEAHPGKVIVCDPKLGSPYIFFITTSAMVCLEAYATYSFRKDKSNNIFDTTSNPQLLMKFGTKLIPTILNKFRYGDTLNFVNLGFIINLANTHLIIEYFYLFLKIFGQRLLDIPEHYFICMV